MSPHVLALLLLLISTTHAQPTCRLGTIPNASGGCTPCPRGTYATNNTCTPCPPGTENNQSGAAVQNACSLCPEGTFSTGGASRCTRCPGRRTSHTGATDVTQCQACGPGRFLDQETNSCLPCVAGTFNDERAATFCQRCEVGFSNPRANSAERCTILNCPPGTEQFRRRCRECNGGFNDVPGGICRRCPAGSEAESLSAATRCNLCEPGFFKTERGNRCEQCPPGTTTLAPGGSFCRRINGPCPLNFFETSGGNCLQCAEQQRLDIAAERCVDCEEDELNPPGISETCNKCNGDRAIFFHSIGVSGSFVCGCAPGRFLRPDGTCAPCPIGTDNIFESLDDKCRPCSPGTYADTPGTVECKPCPNGRTGSFSPPGATSVAQCQRCPPATTTRLPRPFFDSDVASRPDRMCISVRTGCPLGFSGTPNAFFNCEPLFCLPDTPGDKLPNGRPCSPGCEPGQRPVVESLFNRRQFAQCVSCPRFNQVSDGQNECTTCPDGLRPDRLDRSRCVCTGTSNRGFELARRSDGSCGTCPAGSFVNRQGECELCPAGTFSLPQSDFFGEGIERCENCAVDTFTDEDGATRCRPCPAGTFTYGLGETECLSFNS